MLRVELKASERTRREIGTLYRKFPKQMAKAMKLSMATSLKSAKQMAPVLTGALRSSIASYQEPASSFGVIGGLFSNLVYARIQEEGGTITARRAKYLHFQVHGQWVFARSVRIRAQPYLRPGIERNLQIITKYFQDAIYEAFR